MTTKIPADITPQTVEDVMRYLHMLAASRELYRLNTSAPRVPRPVTASYDEIILEHGRAWTSSPRPRGMRKMADRMCYRNSLSTILEQRFSANGSRYRYVEGYAASAYSGFVTEHAWLVDEDGRVIDRTWRYPEHCAYYGLVIPYEIVSEYVTLTHTYGVLANDWQVGFPILELGRLPSVDELREYAGHGKRKTALRRG